MTPAQPRQRPRAASGAPERSERAVEGRGALSDATPRLPGAHNALSDDSGRSQMLVLDGYPSLEQQDVLGPNRGSRRWSVAEERARVQADTAVVARRQGIRPVPPPVHVTYRFVVPDHGRRDWDNYALICKPVQDGLVKAGILVGDHYAVLTGLVAFRVERGQRRLEIVIEEVSR